MTSTYMTYYVLLCYLGRSKHFYNFISLGFEIKQ